MATVTPTIDHAVPVMGLPCDTIIIPFNIDFVSSPSWIVDISGYVQQEKIDFIQSIYIDNLENTESVSVRCDITSQEIVAPAHSQGYYTLFIPNMPVFTVESDGAVIVNMHFTNIPLMPCVWGPNPGGALADHVIVDSGNIVVDSITDPVTTNEGSISITEDNAFALDGTSQVIVPANACYFLIVNPTGNNDITISIAGGDALAALITINAGGNFLYEGPAPISNTITVAGTNTEVIGVSYGIQD